MSIGRGEPAGPGTTSSAEIPGCCEWKLVEFHFLGSQSHSCASIRSSCRVGRYCKFRSGLRAYPDAETSSSQGKWASMVLATGSMDLHGQGKYFLRSLTLIFSRKIFGTQGAPSKTADCWPRVSSTQPRCNMFKFHCQRAASPSHLLSI